MRERKSGDSGDGNTDTDMLADCEVLGPLGMCCILKSLKQNIPGNLGTLQPEWGFYWLE